MTDRASQPVAKVDPLVALGQVAAFPIVCLLIAVLITQNVRREDELGSALARSYAARADLQALVSLLKEAETGRSAYGVTGRREDLRPYLEARTELTGREGRIAAELAQQPGQTRRFHDLSKLAAAELDGPVPEVGPKNAASPAQPLRPGRGSSLTDRAAALAAEMSRAEATELEAKRAAAVAVRDQTNVIAGSAFLAFMALIFVAQTRDRRHASQRTRLLHQLEDSSVRLAAVVEGAMDGIITLNAGGGIETVNTAGARMFGYAPAELLHRDVSILAEGDRERFDTFIERLQRGDIPLETGVVREFKGIRRDGGAFPIDVGLRGVRLPNGLHVVAVVRDITPRRRVETLKQEFVSTVSHELRTPLTSIAGALGLLRGGAGGVLPERASRLVQIAESNSARLVRLINNILDMEKFESGQASLALSPQSLTDIAQRAADMMEGLAEKRGVSLRVVAAERDPTVQADADRVLQVLTNLLSNAIKFSEPAGEVEMRIEDGAECARVAVVDHGSGVPPSFRSRLFQKFAQADGSDARSHIGSGLGLAIAREIAELHGGALKHEETPGGGASFLLDLPRAAAPPAPVSARPRLLVCEDDVLTADLLRQELGDLGYDVDVAGAANEARLALHTGRYAALLLDLGLPDADGLTLVRALRAALATRDIPIIIVSRSVERPDGEKPPNVVDWIEKPIDFERLKRAVDAATRRERATPLILHVDRDRDLLEVARGVLGGVGEVMAAHSLAAAREALRRRRPDVVVLDLGLPDGSGADLIADLEAAWGGRIPVIVYTAQEPQPGLDERVVGVYTKSRIGLQRLADAVRRAVDPVPPASRPHA